MKSLMIGLALTSSLSYGQVGTVVVSNFNFNYKDPAGTGTASVFSRSFAKTTQRLAVTVDRLDKDFRIVATGAETQEFLFTDAPSFMVDARTMSVSGFNLNLGEKFTASLAAGQFVSADDNLGLDNLSLDCSRDQRGPEVWDQVLSGCVQRLILKAGRFNSAATEAHLPGLLGATILAAAGAAPEVRSAVQISGLDLRISGGKYNLSAEVRAQISGKVTSTGTASYDSAKGVLALRISEVKFGFLNVTDKVFDELKKNESEKLTVKPPFVYYSLR
jgi:hypothetical protein